MPSDGSGSDSGPSIWEGGDKPGSEEWPLSPHPSLSPEPGFYLLTPTHSGSSHSLVQTGLAQITGQLAFNSGDFPEHGWKGLKLLDHLPV